MNIRSTLSAKDPPTSLRNPAHLLERQKHAKVPGILPAAYEKSVKILPDDNLDLVSEPYLSELASYAVRKLLFS